MVDVAFVSAGLPCEPQRTERARCGSAALQTKRSSAALAARAALLVGAALTATQPAAAAEGFALNRFEPAERGSDWFSVESLDMRGHGRWATGIVGDWSHRPLVIYDEQDDELQAVIGDQVFAYVGASAVWADRWRLAASFPVVLVNRGDDAGTYATSLSATTGTTVGDLRISGDARLLGRYGEAVTVAAGAHLHVPTGSTAAFTGDDHIRAQPHVLVAGDLGRFEYAFKTGVNLRAMSELLGAELGSEWVFAAAGGVRLVGERLLVGPEIWGGTLIDSSFGAFDQEGTPVEALLGAHYRLDRWQLGLAAGPGLSRGLGAPELRALASLEWIQTQAEPLEEPPPDQDADGFADAEDACPTQKAGAFPDLRRRGCPAPKDADADGIADDTDACPAERGEASSQRERHGCPAPPPAAPVERCSTQPGAAGAPADLSACPAPDRDADGVDDDRDACPDLPGDVAADPQRSGCPLVALRGDRLELLEPIEFENNRADFRAESASVLAQVARFLTEHPEIRSVDIQGHTDARGSAARNVELSRQRAAAVRQWLIEHDVAAERLDSHGFGASRPIDDNETDLGRQRNRRVEFHVQVDRGQ